MLYNADILMSVLCISFLKPRTHDILNYEQGDVNYRLGYVKEHLEGSLTQSRVCFDWDKA